MLSLNKIQEFLISKGITNFAEILIKYELQNIIATNAGKGQGNIIKAAQNFLRTSKETSSMAQRTEYTKEQETKSLIEFVTNNNLWNSAEIQEENLIGQGVEQKVYFTTNGESVIKLNDAIFYTSWYDYLNSLLLHNYFFPSTSYTLLGFKIIDEKIFSVVEQSFVNADNVVNLANVESILNDTGFIKPNPKRNDYKNDFLGIILEDLHDENVLVNNNVLFYIDTVFYLKDNFYEPTFDELEFQKWQKKNL